MFRRPDWWWAHPGRGGMNRLAAANRPSPGRCSRCGLLAVGILVASATCATPLPAPPAGAREYGTGPEPEHLYQVHPIGWVRKEGDRTTIVVDPRYQPSLLGVADLSSIWVLYWFDRNDTPEKRSILQVHPRRDTEIPVRGVFATRAPVRPNLIGLSRCRVLSVEGNVIEIDGIDAFPDTPVLDIKP